MGLKNKVIVITGGTHGLGKALALLCVEEGSHVIICARNEDKFDGLIHHDILAIKADVTKEGDLQNVMNAAVEKFGRVDVWINNAGIWLPHKPIEEVDWKRAHDLIEVNLFGTVYGSKLALIQMRKQGEGAIVNILSTSALEGRATSSAYSASKYAARGFSLSLTKEVEGTDIKVVSVYPGGMQTDFFDEKRPVNYSEYMESRYVADKIVENLKKNLPEEELIIKRNM